MQVQSSDIGKRLIDEGIKHAPDLYRFGTSKIKNENVRKTLESDVANYIVEETQNKTKKDLNNLFGGIWKMSDGISNSQTEEAFKIVGDEDMENNFVDVFPSNHRNKFINHKLMISDKKEKNICS